MNSLKQKLIIVGFCIYQMGCNFLEDQGTVVHSEAPQALGFEVTTDPSASSGAVANPDVPLVGSTNPNPSPIVSNGGIQPWTVDMGFQIEGGATLTNHQELVFDFDEYNRMRMKVSTNDTCTGGVWEDIASQKTIAVTHLNQILPFSVRYLDYDLSESACYKASIVQDSEGPEIIFAKYPNQSMEPSISAEITVNISDRLSSVKSATCELISEKQAIEKSCAGGSNSIQISPLPEGNYSFVVHAEDILGNQRTSQIQWSVVSTTRFLSQAIQVNDYKKVDILFVIDNSGSMAYEQKNMASRVANFLSVIRGLDYQVAVTTTDPRSSVFWGDGQLLSFSQNVGSILDIRTPESEAQILIGQTLQRSETGSSSEQAINATFRVIDRYINNEAKQRQLFREGAQFAVINISDEDESANGPKNDPEALVKHVHDTFGGQKTFSFHSIITKPGDVGCKMTYGATYGERYKKLSDLTGGVIGSVCEMDYAAQVSGIAQGVRNLLKTMSLQCQPITAGFNIGLKKDGQLFSGSYRVDGVNLVFDQELAPGNYQVDYHCLK